MEKAIGTLFLKTSGSKLNQMTGLLITCLHKLSDEQVWEKHGAHENAVGNLVLHLCGNLQQLIMHTLAGAPNTRVREAEFSQAGGLTVLQLIDRFQASVTAARQVIDDLEPEQLLDPAKLLGRDATKLQVIYQAVGHLQQHVGQIILLTKQMTGKDLDLTIPRPR